MPASREVLAPRLARQVAVVGPREATLAQERDAYDVAAGLAAGGLLVVTGGMGGVMAAACRGALEAGGRNLALLPGDDPEAANPWADVVVPTGVGEARDVLVVRSAAVVVAVGGGWGTLAEVALALRLGLPVVSLGSWAPVPPAGAGDDGARVVEVSSAGEAVAYVLSLVT